MDYPEAFDIAVDRLLGHEGGYVNNRADPGGETNWGISKRSYPTLNIRGLTRDAAIAIYYRDFWQKLPQVIPEWLAFDVLDIAVNSGYKRAVMLLQQAIGERPDGEWGPEDTGALASFNACPGTLQARLGGARLLFMASLDGWATFGKGWARRVASNLLAAG